MTIDQAKLHLKSLDKIMSALNYTQALMGWDSMTLASKKGIDARSEVIGSMSELYFKQFINEDVHQMLTVLNQEKEHLDELTQAKLRIYTEDYERISKIPMDEYTAYESLIAKSNVAWEEAKNADDFSLFQPYLEKVLQSLKKFVEYRGFVGHPYNTYLGDYETGLTVEAVDHFFSELKQRIVPLVKKIQQQSEADLPFIHRAFDLKKQEQFSQYLMEQLNFRMDCGTIAVSAHPFTMNLSRNDVRITTHYHESDLLSAISSTIHETGHALYEQNINESFGLSALTTGTSMGIHESQSRIYENNFGRSIHFWKKHFPKLVELFGEELSDVSLEAFHQSLNTVKPSLIRIEADEVTYPLHIMVRYEMEKMIMTEDIPVSELPKIWMDKYEEYLGIRPTSDKVGILQDVHWSEGLFGYFPSYALGSAYAAQFQYYMGKDIDIDALLEQGNMEPIRQWLTDRIHIYGSSKTPNEILEIATGEPFNSKYFIDYLEEKYTQLYNISL
jgi:carboxypeptidase Taq